MNLWEGRFISNGIKSKYQDPIKKILTREEEGQPNPIQLKLLATRDPSNEVFPIHKKPIQKEKLILEGFEELNVISINHDNRLKKLKSVHLQYSENLFKMMKYIKKTGSRINSLENSHFFN